MRHPKASDVKSGARARALATRSETTRNVLVGYFRRRVRDNGEIDDLVQEVFLRIVVRGDTQDIDHLDGYIFKTASSVLADRHRRRTVRHADDHLAFDAEVHAELDFDAERTLLGREALRTVSAALPTLPARTRDIFLLRRLEGIDTRR